MKTIVAAAITVTAIAACERAHDDTTTNFLNAIHANSLSSPEGDAALVRIASASASACSFTILAWASAGFTWVLSSCFAVSWACSSAASRSAARSARSTRTPAAPNKAP